jgi:hypothetical protein
MALRRSGSTGTSDRRQRMKVLDATYSQPINDRHGFYVRTLSTLDEVHDGSARRLADETATASGWDATRDDRSGATMVGFPVTRDDGLVTRAHWYYVRAGR